MKALTIAFLSLISIGSYAMNYNNNAANYLTTPFYNNDTTTSVVIENDSTISLDKSNDSSTFIEYNNVNIEVVEGDNSTQIIVVKDGDTIKNYEMNYDFNQNDEGVKNKEEDKNNFNFEFNFGNDDDDDDSNKGSCKNKRKFKGHWSGFEFGLNNYVTNDYSIIPNDEDSYMEINTGKSWNFNLNFAQVSVPLIRDRIGLVSGLGFEWSNYHFSNNNTIVKNTDTHCTESEDLSDLALKKNKLTTTYLTAPILLEAQLGSATNRKERMAISAGVIGGLKIGSHTKYKTNDSKEKNKDDFYLQSLRYGFTARINYQSFGLYFNYYNMPLFIEDKGPELYPFAAGLIVSFN